MIAAFVATASALLLAVTMLRWRVSQLAADNQGLRQSLEAQAVTQAALVKSVQALRRDFYTTAGRDQLAALGEQVKQLGHAQKALERQWGLDNARRLLGQGASADALVTDHGLTPAEAELIARLTPAAQAAH